MLLVSQNFSQKITDIIIIIYFYSVRVEMNIIVYSGLSAFVFVCFSLLHMTLNV